MIGDRQFDRLRRIVENTMGAGTRDISIERLTGGASRETLRITATVDGQPRQLIARIDRSGPGPGGNAPLSVEAMAMRAAAASGVPVAPVYNVGDDVDLGGSWMLMEAIDGETIARRILRDDRFQAARASLTGQLAEALARIHLAEVDDPSLLDQVGEPLRALEADVCAGYPIPPGLALGLKWLRDHPVDPAPSCLVHGDFRLGNLMIDDDGLQAVLDWELTRFGDPLEDLGWLCAKVWRFGSERAAAGVGSREELLDAYATHAGWRPTEEQLHWWELYATVRWGLMCTTQADRFLTRGERSVELVAIGRRTAEQEFDVLLGLDLALPHENVDAAELLAPPAPYGIPTAIDLVNGVLCHLEDSVMPLGGAIGFEGRVAAHVMGIIGREIALGPVHAGRHRQALSGLDLTTDADLSQAILDGSLEDRRDDLTAALVTTITDRITVANPRHTQYRW